jgi:hypothetical protein
MSVKVFEDNLSEQQVAEGMRVGEFVCKSRVKDADTASNRTVALHEYDQLVAWYVVCV